MSAISPISLDICLMLTRITGNALNYMVQSFMLKLLLLTIIIKARARSSILFVIKSMTSTCRKPCQYTNVLLKMVGRACHPGPTVVTFFPLETKQIFFLSLRYLLRCSLQAYTLVSNALANIFFFTLLHIFHHMVYCSARKVALYHAVCQLFTFTNLYLCIVNLLNYSMYYVTYFVAFSH